MIRKELVVIANEVMRPMPRELLSGRQVVSAGLGARRRCVKALQVLKNRQIPRMIFQ